MNGKFFAAFGRFMRKFKPCARVSLRLAAACFVILESAFFAWAEEADEAVYEITDENGAYITSVYGRAYPEDEYISGGNLLYIVETVDDEKHTAVARLCGEEPQAAFAAEEKDGAAEAFSALSEEKEKRVCMYSTHSDESYIPGDGESSLLKNAGIYDVGEALKEHLTELGVKTEYSKETFFPHDAGAYKRSRSVAAELLKESPDALIDIHRDGVAADEYETTVNGDETSKVRLFVGKTNANAAENRAFAKKLKAIGDEMYPGLIKDIYIGKGNYNQDLYPRAILLEFGTHEIEKERAIDATKYMANVIYTALYDEKAGAAEEENAGAAKGIGWLIGIAVVAAIAFAVVSTGSYRGAGEKLKRTWREATGGAFGGKKGKN